MNKTISTISDFITTSKYQTLVDKADTIGEHVDLLHTEFKSYQEDHAILHRDEKESYKEMINELNYSIHKLKVAILWMVGGLICSGVSIIGICIHLIS